MLPLKDQTVLITGATSGIGRSTARLAAAQRCCLILTGRRRDRLETLQEELEHQYDTPIHISVFDVREERSVQQALDALPESWRDIDVLINNAGLALGLHPLHKGQLSDWETMIDTNIKGLLYVSRWVGGLMCERGAGLIVNVGSIAGKEAYPNGNVYVATKHAVDGLTRAMRMDFVAHGVRVGQIAPGHVETEFALNRFHGDEARADAVYEGFRPLHPDDVAEAILFMMSRPQHVNVNDMVIMARDQASATHIHRSGT